MSSAPSPQEIWKDARWLAQAIDPNAGLVRVIEMDAEAYRSASFLDDRMLQQPHNAHLLKWDDVAAARPADAPTDARWIFHIGHVGSTLVARLLGELDSVLSVREPRALRDIVMGTPDPAPFVPTCRALYARTLPGKPTALVKATSFVSEIAASLVGETSKAIFMFATPRAYIQGILAGENSRKELRALAGWRSQRMQGRVFDLQGSDRTEAHLAAAAWACEMTSLTSAAETLPAGSVLWADFDVMLDSMSEALQRIASFAALAAPVEQIDRAVAGPLMRRYSKALEYEYSPALRRELLSEAGRDHRQAIDAAIAMLERSAQSSPLLASALARVHSDS